MNMKLLPTLNLSRDVRVAIAQALRSARVALTTNDIREVGEAAVLAHLEAIAFADVDRGADEGDSLKEAKRLADIYKATPGVNRPENFTSTARAFVALVE